MRYKKIVLNILLIIILGGTLGNLALNTAAADKSAYSNEVIAINWDEFNEDLTGDDEFYLSKEIMTNSSQYILSTWYEEHNYHLTDGLIDFDGHKEHHIRGPAMAALGAAVPIATRNYDSEKIGLPLEEALNRTVLLINSLSSSHVSNDEAGWGYKGNASSHPWQTPLWGYYTGFAGWLLWDYISEDNQEDIRRMVEWEANHIPEPRYYRSEEGGILYKGNTQAEENSSWASLLGLAVSMMPHHKNAQAWTEQMIDLALAAFAKPSDTMSGVEYNNRTLNELLRGSNIEENGTVINHGFMHPIYMLTIEQNMNIALLFSLAQLKIPTAVLHNADNIYYAFTDLHFDTDEYLEPGGTIYREGSSAIYYPEGNDWGKYFPLYFGQVDVLAGIFAFDEKSNSEASTWSKLHNEEQLRLRNRFTDGRTYKNDIESNYGLKEERIAQIASSTFLAKWLEDHSSYSFSDSSYDNFVKIYKPYQKQIGIHILIISIVVVLLIINNKGFFSRE